MAIILRLLRFCLGGCRHRHMYRERRSLHGTQVLHLVCEDCGHAVPAIQRTAREHQLAVKNGAVKPSQVRRLPADVVAFGGRRHNAAGIRSATAIAPRKRAQS
jgi:hypothetical protein